MVPQKECVCKKTGALTTKQKKILLSAINYRQADFLSHAKQVRDQGNGMMSEVEAGYYIKQSQELNEIMTLLGVDFVELYGGKDE